MDIQVSVYGDPERFYVGETYTFISTLLPDTLGSRNVLWRFRRVPNPMPTGSVIWGSHSIQNNREFQNITFNAHGTIEVTIAVIPPEWWDVPINDIVIQPDWVQDEMTIQVHPRPDIGVTTPPVFTPLTTVSSGGGGSPSPAPGSAQANFSTGMSFANRTAINVRNTATNATTGESILQSIQAGLPSGVTAEWSQHSPFVIVPATYSEAGSITGTVIITSNNWYRSAIRFNIELPTLTGGDTE